MMFQDYPPLSKLISAFCEEISKRWQDKQDLVTLDIASGYHSYTFDISKSNKTKVCMHQSKHLVNCLPLNI